MGSSVNANCRQSLARWDPITLLQKMKNRRLKPEDGFRFCDLLLQEIQQLQTLGGRKDVGEFEQVVEHLLQPYRELFLSLGVKVHNTGSSDGDSLCVLKQLFEKIKARKTSGKKWKVQEPFGRCNVLLELMHNQLKTRIYRWYSRFVIALGQMQLDQGRQVQLDTDQQIEDELNRGAMNTAQTYFPPPPVQIPVKPLVLDLANGLIKNKHEEDLLEQEQLG